VRTPTRTSKDYARSSGVPTESYATAIANIESESETVFVQDGYHVADCLTVPLADIE